MTRRSIPAMLRAIRPLLTISLLCFASRAPAQLPAFNGAEGFGGTFTGAPPAAGWFSNATVYHVTNLNDSGPGSLRAAFVENSANKIVVFDVGGTIQLTRSLDIKNLSNYYIAGQTAPSPVTIYGDTTQLTHSSGKTNSNVILRYLTFRKGTGNGEDAITFAGSGLGTNLILDHVSASWSEDEVLSVANNNTNVTVQYSIISDALVSNHAYGSLIRPRIDSNASFHHNLYAHNASRQARFGTYNAETLVADFRNNVIYNWRDRASYAGGSSEAEQEYVDTNYVGNYLIAGPGTVANTNRAFIVDRNVDVRAYQSVNFIDSDRQVNPGGVPNGADTGWNMFAFNVVIDQTLIQMAAPFGTAPVTTQSAIDAYHQVLEHVGNYWWSREAIDARVINNVRTNTNAPNGIGAAAPPAAELAGVLSAPMTTWPAGWDSDNDGMPDPWEVAHGLDPNSNLDFKLDFDNDGYVNLQEYLDEIGAFPAPAPIVFNGATNNRYAQITNWKTDDGGITAGSHWQPMRFDEAQINSGTVVVDAVGQHAGALKLGANAGDNATLNITGGWLDVDEELLIGAEAAATAVLNLNGGVLSTPRLSKGAGGTFNLRGGMLHADVVDFDLYNQGATIAPGHSIGQTRVAGDLILGSGTLEIELAAASLSDTLLVDGAATLGGSLAVSSLGGFRPTLGDSWQIITAGSITGAFDSITPGYSLQQQGGNLLMFFGPAPSLIAGDYNGDGTVDAADYVVWRSNVGTTNPLLNETASPGIVDHEDYTVWRARFGTTAGPGSGQLAGVAVPEPSSLALLLLALVALVFAPNSAHAISWKQAQRQQAKWFQSAEGRQVVDNVLLYQFPSGGWPKNIDMARPLSPSDKQRLAKRRDEATIDNGGTYTQLRFLANAYSATNGERVRDAFLKGLDYLFEAQYDNGGWPIFHPPRGGYSDHIHFNDNSVSGVLKLMDDVAKGDAPFDFVDAERKRQAAEAFARGIDCILKCQVIVDGQRTAWCAQHDEHTLAPAAARNFEPVSLSGHESVDLVRCLMRVENPSAEIIAAVRDAVAWLDRVKIEGIRVVRVETPEGRDLAAKEDADAPPIWARFYEIGTNRPIFTGRDSIVRYRYDEIERERRLGYAYYGDWPAKLLSKEYPKWSKTWGVTTNSD